jgi:hypothetical protein
MNEKIGRRTACDQDALLDGEVRPGYPDSLFNDVVIGSTTDLSEYIKKKIESTYAREKSKPYRETPCDH